MHGEYARHLDPSQAMGLAYRPTAMLPRVVNFGPEDPTYTRLANLPVAGMAMLSKKYKGTPSSLANRVGKTYEAAAGGDLPSTHSLLKGMVKSPGLNDLFSGVKAKGNVQESFTNPGYEYGKEPLAMGEAAQMLGPLVDAALVNEPLLTQQKYSGTAPGSWGSYLIDKGSSKSLKKPAGKGKPLNRYVGKRLFR